jgi:hypothetical protein
MKFEKNQVKKHIIVFVMEQYPKDMKIVGCFTDYMKCVKMTEEEKKQQSPPPNKIQKLKSKKN